VIVNLLTNASKYTPSQGSLRLVAGRHDDAVVIAVEDSGIGIEPHMLDRVFELFAQADQAPDRSRGGLGIGLSLARRLVELHGGALDAFSEGPGRGSRFLVRLPAAAPEERPHRDTVAGPAPAVADARRSVLVVDDNRDAAEALALFLAGAGFDVTTVHDGVAAVAEAERRSPDVVLLDLGLPLLDGFEVAERLRRVPGGPRPRLIAVSGYGQAGDRQRTASAGFEHHLVKPIDYHALVNLLSSVPSGTMPA
jgi:CheY-like chemotaxis protein